MFDMQGCLVFHGELLVVIAELSIHERMAAFQAAAFTILIP
jgi:hypothetical protein